MIPSSNEIFSTRVVVESDQGIAILQRAPTGEFKRAWELPGGKLEEGEDLFDGALRETWQELGIEVELASYEPITIEERRFIADGKHKGKFISSFGFVAVAHSNDVQLSDEHIDMRWVNNPDSFNSQFITPTSHETIRKLGHLLYTKVF
jgi:8-oxo-dGTP pyrophosphatase MutT (NUDIX family)